MSKINTNRSIITGGPGTVEDSIPVLARALFRGDLADDQVRSLPTQQLFYAIKEIGLQSAQDLLEVITSKQYSTLLDFELWTKDSFREERFWAWLEVIDDPQNLLPIQKFLNCIDSTIMAYLIRRYVDVVYHDEPDDAPPGPNFYTPDQGATWLSIKTHDPERHRLFGKLLAFIYQTNLDYFYRLLLQSTEGTSIEFEEIGYNEKSKRLEVEDIPTFEEAEKYHRAVHVSKIVEELDKATSGVVSEPLEIVKSRASFFSSVRFQPLLAALEEVSDDRLLELQSEVMRILNCAVVFFLNDFGEDNQLRLLSEQVFGVINVGLQIISKERPNAISNQGMTNLQFSKVYALGLSQFYDLRKIAHKIPDDIVTTLAHMNQQLSILIECVKRPLPCVPSFFREDGSFEMSQEGYQFEFRPISSIDQITSIKQIIEKQVLEKGKEIRSYEATGKKHSISTTPITNEPQ